MLKTCSELMQKAYQLNWITSRDGNISVRNRDREHFWITPSGIRKPMLDPDMWKKVSLYKDNGEFVCLEHTNLSSNLEPSGETPLHYGKKRLVSMVSENVVYVMIRIKRVLSIPHTQTATTTNHGRP